MSKKLRIKYNTKIYVVCPGNVATGGPELLHQLVFELNKMGLNGYMFYYKKTQENPIHDEYLKYNNNYVESIDDNEDNILIVPEINTDIIYNYKNIQKVVWWLSIDNYYKKFTSDIVWKKLIKKLLCLFGYLRVNDIFKENQLTHFVQSEYARKYLMGKKVKKIYFLGDYLNEYFIKKQTENINIKKQNIVIYNPKKGIGFTKKIIGYTDDIKFVPIENMTREEVAMLLLSAKVYIDFGNHPGKDRIPREAAISGCCVITSRKGSAKYYDDVAINDDFKFEDNDENISIIIDKIKDCLINYEQNIKKFDIYRDKIVHEQENFIKDIKNIFEVS
jgi:hypothetical protein